MITCTTSSANRLELSSWGKLIDSSSRSRQLRGHQEIWVLCQLRWLDIDPRAAAATWVRRVARSCASGEDTFALVLIVSWSFSHRFSCVSNRRVFIPVNRATTKCRLISSADRNTAKHKFVRRGVTIYFGFTRNPTRVLLPSSCYCQNNCRAAVAVGGDYRKYIVCGCCRWWATL